MNVVFFGTPEFAVPSLRAIARSRHRALLVVAQPDRPAGRGMQLQSPAVAEAARELGLPLVQPAKIRNEEFSGALRDTGADAGVVVAYGKILPESLLAIPKYGFINAHASLLPRWRGAAPIQRAIEAGDETTGITIMRIDAELDHGPMLRIEQVPILPDEHTPSLAFRLASLGASLLVRVLDELEDDTAIETPQDHSLATYARKIEKPEGLVAWTDPAAAIYNRFRAFDPWPGISTVAGGETIKLTGIEPVPGVTGQPGTIADLDIGGVVIATAAGGIRITEVQRPGKKPVPAVEWGRSRGLRSGDRLGE